MVGGKDGTTKKRDRTELQEYFRTFGPQDRNSVRPLITVKPHGGWVGPHPRSLRCREGPNRVPGGPSTTGGHLLGSEDKPER